MMKHKIIFFLIFSLLVNFVLAENSCYYQEKRPVSFFSSPYEHLVIPKEKVPFPEISPKNNLIFFRVEPEEIIVPKKILITEKGFEPKEISVKTNQPVVWKNERKQTGSLVFGVREISGMKSNYLVPGNNFTWTFTRPGVYTYVDAVVLGRVGRIVVQ